MQSLATLQMIPPFRSRPTLQIDFGLELMRQPTVQSAEPIRPTLQINCEIEPSQPTLQSVLLFS
jgi:hypothetical protein